MSITLRRLLTRTDLGLQLLTPASEALDAPISWVAATDLPDPSPFIGEGNLVLTTGQQFTGASDIEPYVRRLSGAGIRGIGFASDVVTETPAALVDACAAGGLPLFDVPYRTPFLAVIRYVADLVAAAAQARTAWALGAQRAISLAAMHPDGIHRAIGELARQLDAEVALFDARGHVSATRADGASAVLATTTAEEVSRLLARGVRAASTAPGGVEVQTIGRGGELRGALAVAGPLDDAAHGIIAAVLALAAMGLEQRRSLAAAEATLRSGAWHALVHGNPELAEKLAAEASSRIPERFLVGVIDDAPGQRAELAERDELFLANDGDSLVVLAPDTEWAYELNARAGTAVGLSDFVMKREASEGVRQAHLAHTRATALGQAVTFDAVADAGFRSVLTGDDARAIAAALLRPLIEHDSAHGTRLAASLRAWLGSNGQWDPAAASIGVHRHTLRNRIAHAERILGRDLASARVRADFVLALELADDSVGMPST